MRIEARCQKVSLPIASSAWLLATVTVAALLAMEFVPTRVGASVGAIPPTAKHDLQVNLLPPREANLRPPGVFELALKVNSKHGLDEMMIAAGAAPRDAREAVRQLRRLTEGQVPLESDLRISLGHRIGESGRTIDGVSLSSELGTVVLRRNADGAFHELVQTGIAPTRYHGRLGSDVYWSLRAAGVPDLIAIEARELRARQPVAMPLDAKFDIVVAGRRGRFGDSSKAELQYFGMSSHSGSGFRLLRWQGEGETTKWLDLDRLAKRSASMFERPVSGPITSPFGLRVHPILRFARMHRGLDIGASWGSPIRAPADGMVVAAGWRGGYGRQVQIAHVGGLATSYSHMSQYAVESGQQVRRGDVIGYIGASGLATGPNLHYEVTRLGRAIDPQGASLGAPGSFPTRDMAAIRGRVTRLLSARPS